jgi:hypothetical protein
MGDIKSYFHRASITLGTQGDSIKLLVTMLVFAARRISQLQAS